MAEISILPNLPEDVKYAILGFADLPESMKRLVSKRADAMVCAAVPAGSMLSVCPPFGHKSLDDASLGHVHKFVAKCKNLSKDDIIIMVHGWGTGDCSLLRGFSRRWWRGA